MALLIWAVILLIVICIKSSLREFLVLIIKHFLRRKIITLVLIYCSYVVFAVWCLNGWNLWDAGQIKNTLIWSIFVGIAAGFKVVMNAKKSGFFKEWIIDNLRVTILIEFIISLETLPLIVEIIMQPVLLFFVLMGAHSEGKEEFKIVSRFCNAVLVIAGLCIATYVIRGVWVHYTEYATVQTFQDFYIPILLSLSLTPFLYALYVYSSYERIFIGLHFSTTDENLRRYMKWKAVMSFGADIEFLDRWRRAVLLRRPDNKEDVKTSIANVRELKLIEKNPPHIESQNGWSPYEAQKYLEIYGIIVGDYHEQYDEWFASSPYLNVGSEKILSDNIAYYLGGDKRAVKKLTLHLNVNHPTDSTASELKFLEIGSALFRKATNQEPLDVFLEAITLGTGTLQINDYLRIEVSRDEWDRGYEKAIVFQITTS